MTITINAAQITLAPLSRLQALFGGQVIDHQRATDRWRRSWRWYLTGKAAASICPLLLPYLCVKQANAQLLLRFAKTIGRQGIRLTPEILTEREALKAESAELHGHLNNSGGKNGH